MKQKEIARRITKERHLAFVNEVGIRDDQRALVLPKNYIERHGRYHPGTEHVLENIARADRGELVGVTDKENVGGQVNRLQ